MPTDDEVEAGARAMKPKPFVIYDKGMPATEWVYQRAFLHAEKLVKQARKDARAVLAAAERIRKGKG